MHAGPLSLFIPLVLACSGVLGSCCASTSYYPTSITDAAGSHSSQAISVLSVNDQSGTANDWDNYVEFDSSSVPYSGTFNFNIGSTQTIKGISLHVNYLGQPWTAQRWTFALYLNPTSTSSGSWVQIGNTSSVTSGWASWTMLTLMLTSGDFTRAQDANNIIQIRLTSSNTVDNCDLDFVQLTLSSTSTSSSAASSSASVATLTTSRTSSSSSSTSGGSGSSGTKKVGLRMLILAASSSTVGVDFVQLAFDSTGVVYDFVAVSSSTSLATTLSTSSTTGKYGGIVSVTKNLLSASQQASVVAYQQTYGVKWVVVGSNPSGLAGLNAGTSTTSVGMLTLAPQFSNFGAYLNPSVSIDTKSTINWSGYGAATIIPATIADSSIATPAIFVTIGGGSPQVAAAQIKNSDGTLQLHFFIDEVADYLHSRIFAPLMVNWLSPGGIFQGARRVLFTVQPDDLFLASNLWDVTSHSNPLSDSLTYRLTDADLQSISDYYDALNPTLPEGSHVTVEWPFNGAGTTWYISPDTLFSKAKALQNKFWFLSHTWDHPCDLDTGSYAEMSGEITNNTQFTPSFLTGGLSSPQFSGDSIVTPCITGLFNGQVLKAMVDNGIVNCVGDTSVAALQSANPYHGIPTTTATNGYAGVFIVPRQALDINYDNSIPAEVVDEYNTVYSTTKSFEDIMQIQLAYALEFQLAFRHEPFMLHQANGRSFTYNDPVAGVTRSISLVTLFTDRVVRKLASYYNLPIVTQKFSDLAATWRSRYNADMCGFSATLQINGGLIVAIQVTSQQTCTVGLSGIALSGSSVSVEQVGSEITSWISLTANTLQILTLSTPISL
eukprot:Phypoly_transcript_03040.p1 GENE.Phypoly_transcript_03040~~Phypoly_transcript_03040.p1  ORF type:complete len:833 (+),score=110.97 Phypoly_transcript_03040:44-2542(+)